MDRHTLEDIEALLMEYADAVRATTRARIDAGCCGTAQDFKNLRKAEKDEEDVLNALQKRIQSTILPPKRPTQAVTL